MSLDSHGRQVRTFEKSQRLYRKHQDFKNASIFQRYKSTTMSLDSHAQQDASI